MKILIIGGGFAGCASAEILSHMKKSKITLVEKSSTLGAGVRTYFYGGHPLHTDQDFNYTTCANIKLLKKIFEI